MIVLFFLVVQQQSKDLQNALKKKSFPATLKPKVVTEPEFKYLARYDSHLLSILDIFPQMIIICSEFNDEGPKVVNQIYISLINIYTNLSSA